MNDLRSTRSSVIVIVLITLLFTAAALTSFIEKAANDLIVEARDADARRLRQDAFSALEVTLAVLEDFRQADTGLHSPTEGWSDPLGWAGWTPATEGRTVKVALTDESSKISLNHADITTLTNLFEYWQMQQGDAEKLADAIEGWMQKGYVYATALTPDYEQSPIPYDEAARPMRSFSELAAIDVAKEFFFDDKGRPNSYYARFVNDFSIFNYRQANVNGANPDILAAVGQYTDAQQSHISDYLNGAGQYAQQGAQWFKDTATLASVAGVGGSAAPFGTTITALRILVTVTEGRAQYQLSAVVAPQGGAALNQTQAADATLGTTGASTPSSASITSTSAPSGTAAPTTSTTPQTISYPFTILELSENDQIPPPPPSQPPSS